MKEARKRLNLLPFFCGLAQLAIPLTRIALYGLCADVAAPHEIIYTGDHAHSIVDMHLTALKYREKRKLSEKISVKRSDSSTGF